MLSRNNKAIKVGSLHLSWSGFIFLTVFNISISLIIANLFLWETGFWCHYSIICLFYFAIFFKAFASKDIKKFFSIIRTGLFFIHIVVAFVFLINFWVKSGDARQEAWTYVTFLFKWFFPISLLAICIITILALLLKKIRISRAYLMILAFFPQSIATFNIAISSLISSEGISKVINIVSYVFYLTIVIGFFLVYMIRLIYHLIRSN